MKIIIFIMALLAAGFGGFVLSDDTINQGWVVIAGLIFMGLLGLLLE